MSVTEIHKSCHTLCISAQRTAILLNTSPRRIFKVIAYFYKMLAELNLFPKLALHVRDHYESLTHRIQQYNDPFHV